MKRKTAQISTLDALAVLPSSGRGTALRFGDLVDGRSRPNLPVGPSTRFLRFEETRKLDHKSMA
jgi:hypothetical protein